MSGLERAYAAPIMTLDVEDWEHANFFQLDDKLERVNGLVRQAQYRMDRNVDTWISEFARVGARSTCFVLGDYARRYPQSVVALAKAGHEIACHGNTHDLVYRMDQMQFREWLSRAMGELQGLLGKRVAGFRAPSWSVGPQTPWFCEELVRAGLRYDSSIFPIAMGLFGVPGAPLVPYREAGLLRIPVTVLTMAGRRFPFASGAFFRLSPKWLIHWGLKRAIRARRPAMVVLHPRELDPAHPRLPLHGLENLVHYARLSTTIPKLRSLLDPASGFEWRTISDVFSAEIDAPVDASKVLPHN